MSRQVTCTSAIRRGRMHKAEQFLLALLDMKEKAGYSPRPVSSADRKRAARAATGLVELARHL